MVHTVTCRILRYYLDNEYDLRYITFSVTFKQALVISAARVSPPTERLETSRGVVFQGSLSRSLAVRIRTHTFLAG